MGGHAGPRWTTGHQLSDHMALGYGNGGRQGGWGTALPKGPEAEHTGRHVPRTLGPSQRKGEVGPPGQLLGDPP